MLETIAYIAIIIYVALKIIKWWNNNVESKNDGIEIEINPKITNRSIDKASSEQGGKYNTQVRQITSRSTASKTYSRYKSYSKPNDNRPDYVIHKNSPPTEKQKDFATELAEQKGLTLHEAARRRFPRSDLSDLNRQNFADLIGWLLD